MLSNLEDEIELIQRHVKILKLVTKNEPIGIIRLSKLSKLPQHKVRYSLRILEHNGIIKPSPRGAVSTNKAKKFLEVLPSKLEPLADRLREVISLF
jgi:predicted transcriptional regulator